VAAVSIRCHPLAQAKIDSNIWCLIWFEHPRSSVFWCSSHKLWRSFQNWPFSQRAGIPLLVIRESHNTYSPCRLQSDTNSGFAEDLLRDHGIGVFIELRDWLRTLNRFSLCWREILFIWSSFVRIRNFPIVWTIRLFQGIVRPTLIRTRDNYPPTRFSSGSWNFLDQST
jgi:hypothetical protein